MHMESDNLHVLLVALAIGLLFGVERGWQARESREGQRIAGVRTFGLIGLMGGVLALLSQQLGPAIIAVGFLALAVLLGMIFLAKQRQQGDWGITSLIAAMLTYVLAVMAASGQLVAASATAVVAVLLLSCKPQLHGWVSRLRVEELRAGIKLLLISLVLLPVLPDQSYGPWQALNPYRIWLMVVVIASVSFAGYLAVKAGGARRGILFTGLFGGLASSTAVTLHLARLARQDAGLLPVVAGGILLACSTLFVRLLIVVGLLKPSLLPVLWPPLMLMAAVTCLPLLALWRTMSCSTLAAGTALKNPLELRVAMGFGLVLALVMVLAAVLREYYGDSGLIVLALLSGVVDADAIVLSMINMPGETLAPRLFVLGCVVAAAANSLFKTAIAAVLGGRRLGMRVGGPMLLAAVAGLSLSVGLYG